MRAAVAVSLLGAVAVADIGHAAATPAAPAAAATVARPVSPVDATGHLAPGYDIRHRYAAASCESGSPTTGSAYQCFSPQSPDPLYTSCWVTVAADRVDCLVAPWQHKVVRLQVTRGYDDSAGFETVGRPWGVRLARGERCLVILGPVHVVRGKPVNYYCNHKLALAGRIDHHRSAWRVSVFRKMHQRGRPTTYRPLGRHRIAVAWSGQPSRHD